MSYFKNIAFSLLFNESDLEKLALERLQTAPGEGKFPIPAFQAMSGFLDQLTKAAKTNIKLTHHEFTREKITLGFRLDQHSVHFLTIKEDILYLSLVSEGVVDNYYVYFLKVQDFAKPLQNKMHFICSQICTNYFNELMAEISADKSA